MRSLKNFYRFLIQEGNRFQSLLMLIIRIGVGIGFISAGYNKFQNLNGVVDFFSNIGIPFSVYLAPFVAAVELIGGALLLIGLGARLAALPLIVTMIVAYLTAHREAISQIAVDPELITEEPPFLYLWSSLLIFCYGPGHFSIDSLLRRYVFKEID